MVARLGWSMDETPPTFTLRCESVCVCVCMCDCVWWDGVRGGR